MEANPYAEFEAALKKLNSLNVKRFSEFYKTRAYRIEGGNLRTEPSLRYLLKHSNGMTISIAGELLDKYEKARQAQQILDGRVKFSMVLHGILVTFGKLEVKGVIGVGLEISDEADLDDLTDFCTSFVCMSDVMHQWGKDITWDEKQEKFVYKTFGRLGNLPFDYASSRFCSC